VIKLVRLIAQLVLYLPLMALLGYFSTEPRFTHIPEDTALLRLSFSHAGERKHECKQRTPEELAKLPPNMRAIQDCPRERSAVTVELELDGSRIYTGEIAPSGLRRDGASTVYRRLVVPSGQHRIVARLKDRPGTAFNYEHAQSVDLRPGAALLIDFNAAQGGFLFRG
jgi:hypothetical protein